MKRWQRDIRNLAESLPELNQRQTVKRLGTGRDIVDKLDSENLIRFRDGLAKQAGTKRGDGTIETGAIEYDRRYYYFITVPVPLNHRKNMTKIYRESGFDGVHQYCDMIRAKNAEIQSEKLFHKKNRFHKRWWRNIKQQFAQARMAISKAVGKKDSLSTNH